MAIKKSSSLREFEEMVVSLKKSGKSVTGVCLDSAIQTGLSKEFRKFSQEFFSDFAGLLEEGIVSDDNLDAILLSRVSKRFPVLFDSVNDTLKGRVLSALSGVKNEYELKAYREGVISVLQEAYKAARPTNEVVRGNYAVEFDMEVTWSRALDFSVPGMPEVKGLRYIDFADCTLTLTRLLMKDGNSKPVNELTKTELVLVRDGLQKALKNRKGIRM